MNILREITEKYNLSLILVHHTRKLRDADPLNTISGSTGLSGATDGLLVLQKARRTGGEAVLTIANRDTEGFCFDLLFNDQTCHWDFIGNHDEVEDEEDPMTILLNEFLSEEWSGTATELLTGLQKLDSNLDIKPATLSKWLKDTRNLLKVEHNISVCFERNRNSRQIILRRATE